MKPSKKIIELKTLVKTKNQKINELRNKLNKEIEIHKVDLRSVKLADKVIFDDYHKLISDLQKSIQEKDHMISKLTRKKWYQFMNK